MRCVSYTRATSYDPTDKDPSDITVQTEHIREYAAGRGWKISKRYSDKKNDPKEAKGFQQLKEAALIRKFDCVIVDSMMRFGSDVYQTIHFLRNSYYPAGMHFAVAEDDFYSAEHTAEEVNRYLDEKKTYISGRMTKKKLADASIASYFSCYGFRFDRVNRIAELDEESAKIVVEIYERLSRGESPTSIANDMTRRGVENPSQYYSRQCGYRSRKPDPSWNSRCISTIARNKKYTGEWEFLYDASKLDIRCGAIVSKDLYEKVQEAYRQRFTHVAARLNPNPFTNLMWDQESGMKLRYYRNSDTKHQDIRFEYPKKKDITYERPYMPYDEFHEKATAVLMQEKALAEKVLRMIESEEGNDRKIADMQKVRKKFTPVLAQMAAIENGKMDEYRSYQNGEISYDEFSEKETEAAAQLAVLDQQTESIVEELNVIDKIYSEKNPWIKKYIQMDKAEIMVKKKAARLVEKILVYRFESLELIPKELKWKEALPAEWLREVEHGENK